jgi:hypothetical protein
MTTEQKIREAFEKAKAKRMVLPESEKGDLGYYLFKAGYQENYARCANFAELAIRPHLSTPPVTSYLEQWEKEKYGEPVTSACATNWNVPLGTPLYARKD